LDTDTPTYGNRNRFEQVKKSDISNGDVANDTIISTTVHIGTHIDMPYHFYEDGQTIEDYESYFWRFSQKEILFVELRIENGGFGIENGGLIIRDELINKLEEIKNNSQLSILNSQLLIVKTGICYKRGQKEFWEQNYGFHPDIADYLRENFLNIKIFGFDSISVSSFTNRMLGRESHKRFLNPKQPILLLEDMDLRYVDNNTNFKEIIVSPLRIANCDGLPCTVFAKIENGENKIENEELRMENERKDKKQFSILNSQFSIINSQFSTILWDFDGVILDSMKIKADGFRELFLESPLEALEKIESYHYAHGGVSRFDKIRYFYNEILKEEILEEQIVNLAKKFAKIIEKNLYNKENLIMDSIDFIQSNYKKYNFHIVSGAEHNELNSLCQHFKLSAYFDSIEGSPTKKDILVKNVIEKYNYSKDEVVLIGDAMTDYNASVKNGIGFYGYNNEALKRFNYIDSFKDFEI